MTKLNIFQVNGVWHFGRPHQENEGDDEENRHKKMFKVVNLSPQSLIKPNC